MVVPINSDRPSTVDDLVAQGKYSDAARLAMSQGDALAAATLYERIWEFALAADCALQGGDRGRALKNAIDSRDEQRIHDIARALDREGDQGRRVAMEVFAGKRRFAEAAARAEALGEVDLAIAYYRNAHRDLDAARLLEQSGQDRDAGRLLEQYIELGPPGADRARAQLQLGRLLLRRMNHEAASRYLQDAARHDHTRAQAQRALIVALAAMDLRDSARDVLIAARAEDPDLPADIDEFLRAERDKHEAIRGPAAGEQGAREGDAVEVIGGRYRLGQLIGSGGAGRVFHGRDEVSGRDLAVKLFYVAHARGNQAYERFVREAKLAGALRHPNLVEVYDFSADQGYMVMELMSGGSLLDRLARAPLAGPAARRMSLDVLAGLELAHQRGVIHRDVKPANIFFDARGTAKLGDFGVAHLLDLGHTQTGGLIGTLAYMSPEQITGAPLTITADLYSLGVTLFEALCGRLPFLGPDFVAQHLGEEPPRVTAVNPDIAPGWDPVIAKLMQKSPSERFAAIEDLRRAIMDVDLGDADRPRVLILRRSGQDQGAGEPAGDQAGDQAGAAPLPASVMREAAMGDGDADAGAEELRYQFETALLGTDVSRLSRAVDTVLNRSVIIERYGEGTMDADMEQRLYALARGGGPFVQRALAYDRDAGVAVFEAPSGTPVGEAFAAAPPAPRRAARLLKRLARAVAPLHESQNVHGALSASTILVDDDANPTVLVCGLGRVDTHASPRADVDAIFELMATITRAPRTGAGARKDLIAHLLAGAEKLAADTTGAEPDARQDIEPGIEPDIEPDIEPATGEELYALADTIEVAMLRAVRRARSA